MKSVSKYLPISLLRSLNEFNTKVIPFREEIELTSSESKINISGTTATEIKIKYSVKDRNSYFEIIFIPNLDYLYYHYYPSAIISSKTKRIQKQIFDENILTELNSHLEKWRLNIVELLSIKDPLDFFNDTFVESYSAEIIDYVGNESNEKEYYPLTIEKQIKVIELINEQKSFIQNQIEQTEDKTSEKYKDLNKTIIELEYIQENLPRLTVKELKERWSSTFAVLIKWCAKQLATFAKIDAQNDGNISRSIGNLIGGIFNLPRME